MGQSLMPTYARLPITFTHGEGIWLWDTEGRCYLDALSGIAVCGLGHAHPAVTAALCEQAGRLLHTSNLYQIEAQQQLGDRLTRLAGMDRVFFGNSGAEANEAAIKLARLHAHHRGIGDPTILVMESSFHGRTLATLTATGNRKVQAGFEPLVQGFVRVPYNDLDAIDKVAANRTNIVAVLVEPILGEGGVVLPAGDYLAGLRERCDRHGWLLMLDEIQTGMGRTGRLFAHQHARVQPDVMTLAKGLANGVPIGACLARGAAAEVLGPGSHGSTFGGNPLACRAALAVLQTLEQEDLAAQAARQGTALQERLRAALGDLPGVRDIRGLGLMIGIELKRDCPELVRQALERGLLINVTAGRVVRLLPPLIIRDDQVAQLADGLSDLIRKFLAQPLTEPAE
ncbi:MULTISPECIES: aspartate aminotransferase family protein [Thiorhodovibrio]|uniref:aspartate aminotransferase family protein n=1 Tax=Thiorhodovibrio TaxID=61593 RepID=UPI001912DD23|nr:MULTISPECIES: aspartate aminotransferase family protein [Thiorhodovibrio]MBK5968012.1 aspartate aminotransferase family protein [Thiorhodovibrio winogradskyi]WPL11829.1 Acetylornithine aminotransferase [Thiorhodovibrio litoralis]